MQAILEGRMCHIACTRYTTRYKKLAKNIMQFIRDDNFNRIRIIKNIQNYFVFNYYDFNCKRKD